MADDQRIADLYEEDFYLWTQAQADALRAAGQAGRLAGVDWERLAGEVEDLGKRDLKTALSLATRIIEHLWLLATALEDQARHHWRAEIRAFRSDLRLELTPSLRRRVEEALESRHRAAFEIVQDKAAGLAGSAAPDPGLRWTLEQVLGEQDDPLG